MSYDFASLSHSEFEDLARDLIGREIELRFEAFPEGPDDGMDGRHARADGSVVMQAKHYHRSGFAALKSKMTKERLSIDRLAPTRYILVTSAQLTPKNKNALAEIIGPSLRTPGDIFGPGDLNALLRKYPDIETAHQKLWAQSTSVLQTVITEAVGKALLKPGAVPAVLANLLPAREATGNAAPVEKAARDTIFLIKARRSTTNSRFGSRPSLRPRGTACSPTS